MTQTSTNYGRVLYELSVPEESVKEAGKIIKEVPELIQVLESPIVSQSQREKVIKKVFSKELENFICVVCRYGHADLLGEIFQAYQEYYNEQNKILSAVLYYVTAPAAGQLEGIKNFLKNKYHANDIALELKEDKSLIGGFVIRTGDREFDYSLKGRIHALQQKLIWR